MVRCQNCDFENREGIKFCEECGELLVTQPAQVCSECGFENRLEVRFCEECGGPLVTKPVQVCAGCGFENRADVRFCEECGEPLITQPTQVCSECGFENRPEVRFCEECGQPLIAKPATWLKKIQQLYAALSHKQKLAIGGVTLLVIFGALFFWLRPDQAQLIDNYSQVLENIQDNVSDTSREYVQEFVPWADPDSGTMTEIHTTEGSAFVVTFEQQDSSSSDFNPKFIIVTDPITGEKIFIEAP